MKETITKNRFMDRFKEMGRGDNFTYHGLSALYDYLEEADENYDLDVIALCCEYSEYENLEELQKDYDSIETMEDLEGETMVIKIDNDSFIIQNF